MTNLAEYIKIEALFDGAIGFSQGAVAASLVASLLDIGQRAVFDTAERQRGAHPKCFLNDDRTEGIQPPFKFVVAFGGEHVGHEMYSAFHNPTIGTNLLAFTGRYDPLIEDHEASVQQDMYKGLKRVIYHPSGHSLPQQKHYMDETSRFILEVLKIEDRIGVLE
jgi:hypothetical protein